ncbi:fungal protease inhibitor-1-like [Bacillus rossius redtenbacheri]|uniref:fungal protease inhibitor-1-like n=1 Tax=Bacillus rossius redtenbacheri TaxID=93214 RepID=UPI002FDEF2CC
MGSCALLALLVALMAHQRTTTDALSCLANGCALVDCDASVTAANCVDGEFRENGSACYCCDICIPYVGAGSRCVVEQAGAGVPPATLCRPPLQCRSGRCRKQRGSAE